MSEPLSVTSQASGAVARRPRSLTPRALTARALTARALTARALTARALTTRGFSLIELLVALTLSAVIMTVTTGALVTNMKNEKRGRARSALSREGAFAAAVLTSSLRNAGLGVPVSGHIESGETHSSIVILGTANAIGVVGDFPRPHRHLNSFGELHGRAPFDGSDCPSDGAYNDTVTGPTVRHAYLAWHTPNNGACMPGTGGFACDIGATSVFFPTEPSGQQCTNWRHRSCPWGLGRMSPNEPFQIVAGGGVWTDATFPGTPALSTLRNTSFLDLGGTWTDTADQWTNCTGDAPHELIGAAYVTTLDRMFFRVCEEGSPGTCVATVPTSPPFMLQRKQCWGPVEPTHANWPEPTSNAFGAPRSLTVNADCEPDPDADWETLLTGIESFAFRFVDGGTAATAPATLTLPLSAADKINVRRFIFEMQLRKDVDGAPVLHDLAGSVAIRNTL